MANNREDTRSQARERLNARLDRRQQGADAPSAFERSAKAEGASTVSRGRENTQRQGLQREGARQVRSSRENARQTSARRATSGRTTTRQASARQASGRQVASRKATARQATSRKAPQQQTGKQPPVRLIGLAVIAVVLIVVVAFVIANCSSAEKGASSGSAQAALSSAATSTSSATSGASNASAQGGNASGASNASAAGASASAQASSSGAEQPSQEALADVIGEEEAAKLIETARSDADALWIAAHPSVLAFDGPEVQAKVLKLAADDPLAVPFVRAFADSYPQEKPVDDKSLAMSTASPSANVPSTSVPHLYQWDRRWGYTVYNADAFGLSGCGPTSLAMAYQCVTGKEDLTPYDMGQLAYEGGYVVEWLGTANGYFTEVAAQLGMQCEEIDTSVDSIKATLSSGKPIVANVGKGYFSSYGHYFVLAGLTDDGQIIINDPYSATRSSQAWDPDLVSSESVALYAYSL